jgi:hypothetical protein
MRKTFDLHIAANHIPAALFQELLDSGYREQLVIGGDDRVQMRYLLSVNLSNQNEADELFQRSVRTLKKKRSFSILIFPEITPTVARLITRWKGCLQVNARRTYSSGATST